MFILILLVVVILAAVLRIKCSTPERDKKDLHDVKNTAAAVTIGVAAGIAKAVKDDETGCK